MTTLQWANALSTQPALEAALSEAIAIAREQITGSVDLAIIFLSASFASDASRVMPLLQQQLAVPNVIGCIGGGVVGMAETGVRELEREVGISVSLAHLPGVDVTPFYLDAGDLPDLDASPQTWIDLVGVSPQQKPDFILLTDPMADGITDMLAGLDFAYPQATKVGGLASVDNGIVASPLFLLSPTLAGGRYGEGMIGVALSGNIHLGSIVAQGCRPIGEPFRVSEGERNIVSEVQLDTNAAEDTETVPPLFILRELIPTLTEAEQALVQTALFVGVASDAFKITLQPQDFLIRNVLGVDPRQGAIAIGDRIRLGQRLQFHIRDAQTSAADLRLLLQQYAGDPSKQSDATPKAVGALIFSCLGRGENLYQVPNFDSEQFCEFFPGLPLGGFFCNGEIGQVGTQTYLHGYTSAFAIIHEKSAE